VTILRSLLDWSKELCEHEVEYDEELIQTEHNDKILQENEHQNFHDKCGQNTSNFQTENEDSQTKRTFMYNQQVCGKFHFYLKKKMSQSFFRSKWVNNISIIFLHMVLNI
jgi:hypothetical protein